MEQLTNKKLIERKDKQVPVDWLANEIFNQRLNMSVMLSEEEKSKKKNRIPKLLFNILAKAKLDYPKKYVSLSEVAKIVKTGKEEEHTKIILRRNIQPVKKIFLDKGVLLSNRPGYGYRLDVKKDVVFESIKKINSAMASIINSMVIIRKTDYKKEDLKTEHAAGLRLCSNVVNAMLPILSEFNDSEVKLSLMKKGREDLQELKRYLDELLKSDKF